MSIKDAFVGQLRSVVSWPDPDPSLLFERWTEHGDEIKNASKLVVGPGQGCIFVHEGSVRGVMAQDGLYELSTDNVPFWTSIKSVMQRMESEHKVGIYFFRTAHCVNQRWGTTSAVKYSDPVYNFPVGLRAFGNYSVRITDPHTFFTEIVAGARTYSLADLREVILSRLTEPMSTVIARAGFSYAQLDANRDTISTRVSEELEPIVGALGFQLLDFRIESTNFDEDTERRIGRISDMSAEGQAARAAGIDYATMRQLDALNDAANNEGAAGVGVGLGAGVGLGQVFGAQAAQGQMPGQAAGAQQPAPQTSEDDTMVKLKKLKAMFDAELITEDEYAAKKKELLDSM